MPSYISLFTINNFIVRSIDIAKSEKGTPYAIISLDSVENGEFITVLDFSLVPKNGSFASNLEIGKTYNITIEYRPEYNYLLVRWYREVKIR